MIMPAFPHLPPDLAAGIAAYDEMRDTGRLTYQDHPQHDMPVIDDVPYITDGDDSA